jgi:amino acid transporter
MEKSGIIGWLKALFIGRARSLSDQRLFHKISLVAVLAWVGLGADGLSSSCYGPEETFKALGAHSALSVFVALAGVVTIATICISYRQIIELFPSGGGGYLVASKLLSPTAGVVAGSALLVDYVLTIAISIASGADALFSVLPAAWLHWKLPFQCAGIALLTILNLRGVRESVLLWAPVFFLFVGTHAIAILVAILSHTGSLPAIFQQTSDDMKLAHSQLGWLGMMTLMLKAYSMGAGTYTGIEAVSNGLPILREPRVTTGTRTMTYMGASLAITVFGLMLAYLLYAVHPVEGKTLNTVLFEKITAAWPGHTGQWFVTVSMISATALLFIAAQAGFLDGPRVLANMALDRWFPSRFATLSDRFVTQKGILLMGGSALLVLLVTRGAVALLVVLYSINVFITFSLSQSGMVRHWWQVRGTEPQWRRKLFINGFGLALTSFILISICVVKFSEGGWITLVITGALVALAFAIKRHYSRVGLQLRQLDEIVEASKTQTAAPESGCDPKARTAVLFVNGFNGLGLHTVLQAMRLFEGAFKNFVFVQIGVIDAGNFKGGSEIDRLREHIASESEQYVRFVRQHGFCADAITSIGRDVVEEITTLSPQVRERFPNAVFFGGQLVFERETLFSRWLHNYTVFALQRRFYLLGLPFVTLPIRVSDDPLLSSALPPAQPESQL